MIAGGRRWLEVATLAGDWPESGRKTLGKLVGGGWPCREKEEREDRESLVLFTS